MMNGGEGDLGEARGDMDLKLDHLRDATQFATPGNTERLNQMNRELLENQQEHTKMLQSQTTMISSLLDESQGIRRDIAKLLKTFGQKDAATESRAIGQSRGASAYRIRSLLPNIEGEISEYHALRGTIVDGTCTWVFAEPAWKEWVRLDKDYASPRLLAITGGPGTGKSHIASAVYDHLERNVNGDTDHHIYTAHFYFREQRPALASFFGVMVTAINQLAEQNASVGEKLYTQLSRDGAPLDVLDWKTILRHLIDPCFEERLNYRLLLILDSVDELKGEEKAKLTEFWDWVVKAGLRVSMVVTSQPDGLDGLADQDKGMIQMTKEKQMCDLTALVRHRLEACRH